MAWPPDALVAKLRKFWAWKAHRGEGLRPEDPVFCSQGGRRISPRPFHCTRHTAITAVYRLSRDLFLAQRFARHVSPLTTTVYTHPSDQEMWERVRGLSC